MERERWEVGGRALRKTCSSSARRAEARRVVGAASLVALLTGAEAAAAPPPGEVAAQKGMALARRRDCAKAVPLLEEAERARHMPSSAVALADCYVMTGELLRGSDLYHQVEGDARQRTWTRADFVAQKVAKKKAAEVDQRIPTVRLELADLYDDVAVTVGDRPAGDGAGELRVAPDVPVAITVRARGRKEHVHRVVLHEGERRVIMVRLERAAPPPPPGPPKMSRRPYWLGARYFGTVIPKFLMHAAADGGRTVPAPGGALTFTAAAGDLDLVVSLGYLSLRMGDTPFKAHGTPDTEWEIVSSSLQALTATVELFWSFPLDERRIWTLRLGGGAGVGWTFLGDLHRTQAYPRSGKPGDPYQYVKCKGPNDPFGTFRYCNTLDKDATHYGGYREPDWFHHGVRPAVFPWLALPEVGIVFRPADGVAIDLDGGFSVAGFVTALGVRFAL